MFAQGFSTDELLGAKTESVNQLNMETLRKSPPKLATGAVTDMCPRALDCVSNPFGDKPWNECWIDTVDYHVFSPLGLGDAGGEKYMASSTEQVFRDVAQNPDVLTVDSFRVLHADRPKRYVINGALEAPEGGWYAEGKTSSLQMGPDWSGVPFYPGGKQVTYTKPRWGPFPDEKLIVTVGGGLQSSYAFGGPSPINAGGERGGSQVLLSMPEKPLTLSHAAGISSSAFAYGVTNTPLDALVPTILHWPVTSDILPTPQAARKFKTADGGNLENLGLLAMLQRKVPKVVVFLWTATGGAIPDTSSYDFCSDFSPAGFDFEGKVSSDIADKFGFWKKNSEYDYENNQVFAEKDLGTLMCSLQKKKAAKQAAAVRQTLTVQRNDWWGIEGDWEVELLLLYSDTVVEFQEALPSDTKQALADSDKSGAELHGYPFLPTEGAHDSTKYLCDRFSTHLLPAEINLYSAQAEYAVTQNADVYRAFLQESQTRRLRGSRGTGNGVFV